MQQSSGGGGVPPWAIGAGGAAVGAGVSGAMAWAKRVQSRSNTGMALGLLNTGVAVFGGNANNTEALNAANLVNDTNALPFTSTPTAAEVGALKEKVGRLAGIVSRVASNTDPMSVTGLRTGPAIPASSAAVTAVTAVSTTPAAGLGSVGLLLVIGLGVYLATKDE